MGTFCAAGKSTAISSSEEKSTIVNSTIVGNSVLGFQGGGGIKISNGVKHTLINSIVAGNTTFNDSGNEISVSSGSTLTADASNILGSFGSSQTDAFNGFTPGAQDLNLTSDNTAEPMPLSLIVDGLADNGGLTLTHALAEDSPAIDSGDSSLCSLNAVVADQRGESRDAKCDIGAFEVEDSGRTFVVPLPGGKVVIFSL